MEDTNFKIPNVDINMKVKNKEENNDSSEEENTINLSNTNSNTNISKTQQNMSGIPICPYIIPTWSKTPNPEISYSFEVLKNGVIVERLQNLQNRALWTFGRLPNCNIVMAHPTISRYHAVLQYHPEIIISEQNETDQIEEKSIENANKVGWYLYDLSSTHGTMLNKMRIPPKTYIRVKVGHMIQLGSSTRRYILQGPSFDEEDASKLTITQLKELKVKKQMIFIEQQKSEQETIKKQEDEGISWGMGEDADEESDLTINPYASTNNEELFLDDPKKTLRGYFEREGFELEYKVDEMSMGTFVCRVELPLDDANGKPLTAEICHKGKKKDAVLQCALEACRILDRQGVLRRANHEPIRKKIAHSDSDEDDFLDRTGDIERRRQRKAAELQNTALSHKELMDQDKQLLDRIDDIEFKITNHHSNIKKDKNKQDEDDLDAFMSNLSEEKKMDKTEIRILRIEQQRLKADHIKLQKLIEIAAPVKLPPLNKNYPNKNDDKTKLNLPLFGKRNKLRKNFGVTKSITKELTTIKSYKSDEEEQEEADYFKIVHTKIERNDQILISEENKNENVKSIKKVLGPVYKPSLIEEIKIDEINEIEKNKTINDNKRTGDDESGSSITTKKRRNRFRIRDKNRENVDMDDAEEIADKEKFSQWIPPNHQTGDGYTELNDKFGY